MLVAHEPSATTMNETKELIALRDAALRLGVHINTLRTWVRTGRVPAYRVGERFVRVNWRELLDAIAAGIPAGTEAPSPKAADSIADNDTVSGSRAPRADAADARKEQAHG